MIARIVLDGPPLHGRQMLTTANEILRRTFTVWPDDVTADFLITPGGFIHVTGPAALFNSAGWCSAEFDICRAQSVAEKALNRVLTPQVLTLACGKTKGLTIGVDIKAKENSRHAELVAFVRVEDGAIVRWTGKSYPTGPEENTLVHEADLESHCLHFGGERILILGCHDLNMFSPRAYANQSPYGNRRVRCEKMKAIVHQFSPTTIFQHPHRTDSDRTWRLPWSLLSKLTQSSLIDWAAGICIHRIGEPRCRLPKVLAATRCPSREGLEFIFQTKDQLVSELRVIRI